MLSPPEEGGCSNATGTGVLLCGMYTRPPSFAQVETMPRCHVILGSVRLKRYLSTPTRCPLLSMRQRGGGWQWTCSDTCSPSDVSSRTKQTQPGPASLPVQMNTWDWNHKPEIFPENVAAPFLGKNKGEQGFPHRNQLPSRPEILGAARRTGW